MKLSMKPHVAGRSQPSRPAPTRLPIGLGARVIPGRRVLARVAQDVGLDAALEQLKRSGAANDSRGAPGLESPGAQEDGPRTITDIWQRNALVYGSMTALRDPHHEGAPEMTFSQLYESMQDVAAGLQELGVAKHDKVALFAENSSRWMVADGGVMLCGGCDVVRGSTAPPEELLYIAQHSGAVGAAVQDGAALDRLLAAAEAHERAQEGNPLAALRFVVLLWGQPTPAQASALAGRGVVLMAFEGLVARGQGVRAARAAGGGSRDVRVPVSPEDLATLVYTSGTTGHPKGVMLSHANLAYQVRNLQHFLAVQPGERVLSLLPPWHIYERTCAYFVLSRGGHQVYSNLRKFRDDLTLYPPDHFVCVPLVLDTLHTRVQQKLQAASRVRAVLATSLLAAGTAYVRAARVLSGACLAHALPGAERGVWALLAAAATAAVLAPLHALAGKLVYGKIREALGIRKTVISGGGSLAAHLDDFYETIGLTVLNGWGLTETSPVLACRRVSQNVRGSVGVPTPGTQLRVVDPDTLADLPPGARGLLLARGPGVTAGYFGEEAASAKAFRAGGGWFDTGDLGWIAPQGVSGSAMGGCVVLCGRAKDTLVLSSGKNVEPQPLEDAVQASPLIKFAVLVGQDKRELGALVWPDEEALAASPLAALPPHELQDKLFAEVSRLNGARPDYHPCDHIAHIAVVRSPLSPEDGTLTRTMKPRRPEIMRVHHKAAAEVMKKLRG